jgi:hypothetical protein
MDGIPKEAELNQGLKYTLYGIAVTDLILGALFLFAPSAAEKMMGSSFPDKSLNMLYGQVLLTFSYLAFLAARGGDGLGKLSRIALVLVLGHVLVFAYQLISGLSTFAQVGTPLIVNTIFTVLLFIFRRDMKG